MLRAELQKAEIKKKADLTPEEELTVLARQAKQRVESITAFSEAGRTELADKERAELAVLETYLPKQMSKAEVVALAQKIIDEVSASQKSDMGKVMGKLMPQVKGKADGSVVNAVVTEILASLG